MKNTLFIIVISLAMLFADACKKKTTTPTAGPYSTMDSLYGVLALQPKIVTIDAATGSTFYGNSGTRYTFDPNCFHDATGASVTGNVQIAVTEYLKKGDMIFSKVLPVTDSNPLISAGEIQVNATQNGKEVYIKTSNTFKAVIPQTKPVDGGTVFFTGVPATTVGTTTGVKWKQNTQLFIAGITIGPDSVSLFSDSMHFCNADAFLTNPNYQTFTVTLTANGTTLNSSATIFCYALYDNYNTTWPLGYFDAPVNNVFSEHHVPNIPVHFVACALMSGRFYGGITAATPATGSNYSVTLTEQDPVAFKTSINAL